MSHIKETKRARAVSALIRDELKSYDSVAKLGGEVAKTADLPSAAIRLQHRRQSLVAINDFVKRINCDVKPAMVPLMYDARHSMTSLFARSKAIFIVKLACPCLVLV